MYLMQYDIVGVIPFPKAIQEAEKGAEKRDGEE